MALDEDDLMHVQVVESSTAYSRDLRMMATSIGNAGAPAEAVPRSLGLWEITLIK
jgi:hypothetical protein